MTTRWSPDTCSCVYDVSDDWASGDIVSVCERHSKHADPFSSVYDENVKKNNAWNDAMKIAPDATWKVDNVSGVITISLPASSTDVPISMPPSDIPISDVPVSDSPQDLASLQTKYPDVTFVTE